MLDSIFLYNPVRKRINLKLLKTKRGKKFMRIEVPKGIAEKNEERLVLNTFAKFRQSEWYAKLPTADKVRLEEAYYTSRSNKDFIRRAEAILRGKIEAGL